jgi:hypothetical protein
MRNRNLLLERCFNQPGVPPRHEGRIAVQTSYRRPRSEGFEFRREDGAKLSVTFALDCCEREAIGWVVSPTWCSGDDIRKHVSPPALIKGYLQKKRFSLRRGNSVCATIIYAPCITKNEKGKHDPKVHPQSFMIIKRQSNYAKVCFRSLRSVFFPFLNCAEQKKIVDKYGIDTRTTRRSLLKSRTTNKH